MRNLTISQKTGFQTSLPFEILDRWGNIFYSDEFTNEISEGKVLKFNLPKGNYKYDGYFIKLQNPVSQPVINLPKPDRNYNHGKLYKILFKPNPNKCTIDHVSYTIIFDVRFKEAPVYVIYYIYFHELGHTYYSKEENADLYATKMLLELGFNKTQIALAPFISLSQKNDFRKLLTINSMQK